MINIRKVAFTAFGALTLFVEPALAWRMTVVNGQMDFGYFANGGANGSLRLDPVAGATATVTSGAATHYGGGKPAWLLVEGTPGETYRIRFTSNGILKGYWGSDQMILTIGPQDVALAPTSTIDAVMQEVERVMPADGTDDFYVGGTLDFPATAIGDKYYTTYTGQHVGVQIVQVQPDSSRTVLAAGTIPAFARFATDVQVTVTGALDFGQVTPPVAGVGWVRVTSGGVSTSAPPEPLVIQAGSASVPEFQVGHPVWSQSPNYIPYSVETPIADVTIANANGDTLVVKPILEPFAATPPLINDPASNRFKVGGTLEVPAGAPPGQYQGVMTVHVHYN